MTNGNGTIPNTPKGKTLPQDLTSNYAKNDTFPAVEYAQTFTKPNDGTWTQVGTFGETRSSVINTQPNLIYKKMVEIAKDIGPVSKDQNNTMQGFKFRGIDQFVNALHPALTKHGVFMVPSLVSEQHELKDVIRSNGKPGVDKHVHIQMNYTFYAEDGSNVTVGPIPAESLDSGDKATNKSLSAALKYALIQTFTVPTEDMAEGDLESPEIGVTSKPTVKPPNTVKEPLFQPTKAKPMPKVETTPNEANTSSQLGAASSTTVTGSAVSSTTVGLSGNTQPLSPNTVVNVLADTATFPRPRAKFVAPKRTVVTSEREE